MVLHTYIPGLLEPEAGRGAEGAAGGRARRAARSARRRRNILGEILNRIRFWRVGDSVGIDDLEYMVMKIGEEVMDFEDKCQKLGVNMRKFEW